MHPLNVSNLVIGLIVLGISGLWVAHETNAITDFTYVMPALLIMAGAIGLLAFVLRGRMSRSRRPHQQRTNQHSDQESTHQPSDQPSDGDTESGDQSPVDTATQRAETTP
jgi:cytoskeletal protein RodZ